MADNQPVLKRGASGSDVCALQTLLKNQWNLQVDVDGEFGPRTDMAVKQFQAIHHDKHGAPLAVDGVVGPMTWWALTHRDGVEEQSAVAATPDTSTIAGQALEWAQKELAADAGEVGGNNRGPFVKKYLDPAGLAQGNPWCASFVSWCYLKAAGGDKSKMPFHYSAGARNIFTQCDAKGWSVVTPQPGDLIVWWRGKVKSAGEGHIGFVERVADGFVYTLEGNNTSKVARFRYVLGRIEKLIGFIHIP